MHRASSSPTKSINTFPLVIPFSMQSSIFMPSKNVLCFFMYISLFTALVHCCGFAPVSLPLCAVIKLSTFQISILYLFCLLPYSGFVVIVTFQVFYAASSNVKAR